jgi:hypothetical protein
MENHLARIENLARLGDQITELAAHLDVGEYRFLVLVEAFDREGGWQGEGINSCAHWLNWRCGLGLGVAREKVRVAHAQPELPQISQAFSEGPVSYSKVRAMTRVATPANEDVLLNVARHGTAYHVETQVRLYRQVKRREALEQENLRHAQRELSWHVDDSGFWVLRGRLTPEQGAVIAKALEAAMDVGFAENHAVPPEVHKDLERSIPAETSRRLACDAAVVHWHEDAQGEPLSVGRKTRSIPPAIRRALRRRDGGYRFPGCCATRFVDAHHVHHWADGGETKLNNLVLLCRRHHRLLHEGGFGVAVHPSGTFRFTLPNGKAIPEAPDGRSRGNVEEILAANGANGLHITAQTAVPDWWGEEMDHQMAVQGLLQRE